MAIMNTMHQFYKTFTQPKFRRVYEQVFTVILIVAILIVGTYYAYRWYTIRREQAAQKIFSECVDDYNLAFTGQEHWANVEQLCKVGYEQHRSSSMAPYFLVVQAEALLEQGKKTEASQLYGQVVKEIPKKSPLYGLYATKHALLLIDMVDESLAQEGVTLLTELAHDTSNLTRDESLYYLGLYHWSKNSYELAKKAWQELVALRTTKESEQSPWAVLAQTKLQSL
jgi:hypothetical protein